MKKKKKEPYFLRRLPLDLSTLVPTLNWLLIPSAVVAKSKDFSTVDNDDGQEVYEWDGTEDCKKDSKLSNDWSNSEVQGPKMKKAKKIPRSRIKKWEAM